ncbi:hypothetical protein BY996DRAFT_6427134 [Phakopsora pachyrhizi]|nr:hypothetical protein BY996DRAFT_6427134 [Phakopsora pachyrhizi]
MVLPLQIIVISIFISLNNLSAARLFGSDGIRRIISGRSTHPSVGDRHGLSARNLLNQESYDDYKSDENLYGSTTKTTGLTTEPVNLVPDQSKFKVAGTSTKQDYVQAVPASGLSTVSSESPKVRQMSQAAVTDLNTCDKGHPKAEINRYLLDCNAGIESYSAVIIANCKSINKSNAQQTGTLILDGLRGLNNVLKLTSSSITSCGMDSKPLAVDKGVDLSILANSAVGIVGTLYPVFESISKLYEPYPLIEKSCSETLTNVSTSLSNVIASCGEQDTVQVNFSLQL